MLCSGCDMYTIDLIILFIIQYMYVLYIYSVRTVQWFDMYTILYSASCMHSYIIPFSVQCIGFTSFN